MSWEMPLIQSERAKSRSCCSRRNWRPSTRAVRPSTPSRASRNSPANQKGMVFSTSISKTKGCFQVLPFGPPATSRPSSRTRTCTG
ncbi:Uncharacterised protein [Flavonifractor plautii]|uniref:Uncharacterized protein n=1 Tax=Flavonifractor plautii TaxID=292800 RepID=A0A174E0C1_FLAPL|nr:Uncharacterised protein [Flavonifractor plautii]